MKRLGWVLAPLLAISVAVSFTACDDEGGGGTDAAAGAGGGALGGSGGVKQDGGGGQGGGTAGSGGSGGSGGSTVDAGDAGGGTGGSNADAGGDAAVAVNWASCTGGTKPGVSADDFCTYYETKCSAEFGGGADRYANKGACMGKYNGFDATKQGCAAYHLCVAGQSTPGDTNHCRHAAGGAGNPCGL